VEPLSYLDLIEESPSAPSSPAQSALAQNGRSALDEYGASGRKPGVSPAWPARLAQTLSQHPELGAAGRRPPRVVPWRSSEPGRAGWGARRSPAVTSATLSVARLATEPRGHRARAGLAALARRGLAGRGARLAGSSTTWLVRTSPVFSLPRHQTAKSRLPRRPWRPCLNPRKGRPARPMPRFGCALGRSGTMRARHYRPPRPGSLRVAHATSVSPARRRVHLQHPTALAAHHWAVQKHRRAEQPASSIPACPRLWTRLGSKGPGAQKRPPRASSDSGVRA